MTHGAVDLTRDGALATISFNKPDTGNSVDKDFVEDLLAATKAITGDASVRAVLLRSSGRFFSVGGDLKAFAATGDQIQPFLRTLVKEFHEGLLALAELPVPLVVAVQGPAGGAGVSMACLGDVVVAAESAKFTVAYTTVGLSPDGSGSWFLPRIVGRRVALDLALTNRTVGAEEARSLGLVSRVVPDDRVHAEAETLARQLAEGPTAALAAAKRLLVASETTSLREQLDAELESIVSLAGSADGREGITAFLEKRAPTFSGS